MAISKTPKYRDAENQLESPMAQVFADTDNEDNPKVEDDREKAWQDKFEALQRQIDEVNRTNMALLTQPPKFQSQVVEPVNDTELPDPALDPNGYGKALVERAQNAVDARQRQLDNDRSRKSELDNKVNGLWEDFGEAFPDLVGDQKRIEFAAAEVVEKAKRRGIDPERYMFVTTDKFIKDVGKKYLEIFGEPDVDEDDNNGDYEDEPVTSRRRAVSNVQSRRQPRSSARSEHEVARTSGIFGGNESGGRPAKGKREEETEGSMIEEMQDFQLKSGFF